MDHVAGWAVSQGTAPRVTGETVLRAATEAVEPRASGTGRDAREDAPTHDRDARADTRDGPRERNG